MSITVKIFILPGLNERTVVKTLDVHEGASLSSLLEVIKKQLKLDLTGCRNFIAILDGEAMEVEKNLDRSIEGSREVWFMPRISGG